jgi:2,5-diamino-6-(ribosylamino)-4(3H)-pyrimidinone 5'-phosphate reductase
MLRPYTILNAAMSADGKLDTVARKGIAISSPADKRRVDELRASVDAVLVGGRTLLDEDPKLTVKSSGLRTARLKRGLEENPVKVGVVSLADLKVDGHFMAAGPARKLIYTTRQTSPEQIAHLENAGAAVFLFGDTRVDLTAVMESLYHQGIRRLMVEGGGTILAEFFRLGFVDEIHLYMAPLIFGGASAPTLVDGPGLSPADFARLHLGSMEKVDEDGVLLHYFVTQ